jgi:hypothetical protein
MLRYNSRTYDVPKEKVREAILQNIIEVPPPLHSGLTTNCWIWQKGYFSDGYGGWRGKRIHRLFWEIFVGPIPEGNQILHKCDVTGCGNPQHLFSGTPRDNTEDMKSKGRQARGARCRTYGKGYLIAGANNGRYHLPVSLKTRNKISRSRKGIIPWNKGKKGVQIPWNKGKKGSA